jgi:hypothetical protein
MEENKKEKSKYGTVTVGCSPGNTEKELEIVDFLQSEYKNHRLITTARLEDGSYVVSVENPESTGRNSSNKMRLSEESYVGLISNAFLYFSARGVSLEDMLMRAVDGREEIDYSYSDNLLPKDEKK